MVWNVFLCIRTAKALVRLCGYAGSSKPLLLAYVLNTIISRTGSYRWLFAPARLWVMSLEKRDKRKHFGLFVTSSTVHIDRWRKLLIFEPKHDKTNKSTVRVPRKPTHGQPGHPPSLISLRCPREETVDHKIPVERMNQKFWSDCTDSQADCSEGHDQERSDAEADAVAYVRHFLGFVVWIVSSKKKKKKKKVTCSPHWWPLHILTAFLHCIRTNGVNNQLLLSWFSTGSKRSIQKVSWTKLIRHLIQGKISTFKFSEIKIF